MDSFLLLLCALLVYFIPSGLGWDKQNFFSIFMLNLFLGWTFIGWVIALVWALSKDKASVTIVQKQNHSKADEIEKLKRLLDSGALTQEEFESQKAKILN